MNLPKVLIAILNYNRRDDLLNCINSVFKLNYPNYDLVVVDNNSTDDSAKILAQKYGDKVRVIQNERNLGTAGGYNTCIDQALKMGAQYVFLLNNDVVLERNALSELVNVAMRLPNVGLLGSRVYFRTSRTIWSCGGKINPWLGKTLHIKSEIAEEYKDVDYIPGAAVLIPLEVIKKVGSFDEDYFMYWEDADFCTRLRQYSYRNVVVTKSVIYHRVGCVSREFTALTTYYPLRNRFLYAKKHLFPGKRLVFYTYSVILFFQKLSAIILGGIFKNRADCCKRVKAVFMAYYDVFRGRYGRRI